MKQLHTPRDYQQKAIDWAIDRLTNSSKGQILLIAPPGSGKTLMAAHIAASFRRPGQAYKRVAFLVTLTDLLQSTLREFAALSPAKKEKSCGKSMSIRTVQEVSYSEEKLTEFAMNTDIAIVDEAHLAFGFESIRKLREINPDLKILGLTATPLRMDGYSLKNWVTEYHSVALLSETIAWGGNAPFVYHSVGQTVTVSPLEGDGEDLSDEEARACWQSLDKAQIIAQIKKDWEAGQYPLIVLPRVQYCCELAEMLAPIVGEDTIAMLTGSVPPKYKGRWASSYGENEGRAAIALTVRKSATGFDHPKTKSLHLLYPIQSLPFLVQVLGRALRPYKGAIAHLWDWVGASTNHSRFWSFEMIDWAEFLESKEWNTQCPDCGTHVQACHNRRPLLCPNCKAELDWGEWQPDRDLSPDGNSAEDVEKEDPLDSRDLLAPVVSIAEFVETQAWVGRPQPTKEFYQWCLKSAYNARNWRGERVPPYKANMQFRNKTGQALTSEQLTEWTYGAIFDSPTAAQVESLRQWCIDSGMSLRDTERFVSRSIDRQTQLAIA